MAKAKKAGKKKSEVKFWVGIGASAGGLEALRGFVRSLSDDLSATYIVAQHMAPHHKSMLSEIIGRETSMPVVEVEDGMVPNANSIYITPPNQNIVIHGNKIKLIDPDKKPGAPKPSVDELFQSLAAEKKEFAIGIVLSGTGSDGAKGIRAIQDAGGITIAQDEQTAKYSSMPQTAIETGCVELVMSPEEMGVQMEKVLRLPRDLSSLQQSNMSADNISTLMQLLKDQTKVDFRYYKTATFQRRVERRMASASTASLEEYVELAKSSENEIQALFQDLLISVTSFFRDPVEFEALRPHIEQIVKNKKKGNIRVWIPGTATGEEAYSIAILFAEEIRKHKATGKLTVQMFATDIDSNAIEIARRGFYNRSALDAVPEELVDTYFDIVPSGYSVKKFLREQIVFSLHNIAQDPPFLNVDMISCRNLLIYFQTSLQKEVFNRFHYSLVPNGLLFLGKSEAVSASQALFMPVEQNKHIFFQRPSHDKRAPREMPYTSSKPLNRPRVERPNFEMQKLRRYQQQFESLATSLGKGAILIDENMMIVKAFGDLGDFLTVSAGVVDTKVSSLLREPYRQDLQASVPGVIRNSKRSDGFTRIDPNDTELRIRITVYPIEDTESDEKMALAVFEEWQELRIETDEAAATGDTDTLREQISQLSNELAIAKTNLQQTVEELETSNEELQALNEELQSSNEELQSTNEELETSNEELQSTNEELSTVNEELHVNAQQLSAVNLSLTSILDNITLPLLVVDRNLNITNASGAAESFFSIPSDIVLPNVVNCSVKPGYPNLVDALQETLEKREPLQWNITERGQSATMKIVPHISSFDDLLGAIVMISDNTEELASAHEELKLIFDTAPISLTVRDKDGFIVKANKFTSQLLECPNESLEGKRFYDLFEKEAGKLLKQSDREIIEAEKPIHNSLHRPVYANGKKKWVRANRIPAKHPTKDETAIYSVSQDVTEQYEAQLALKESETRLELAVVAADLGLWEKNLITNEVYWSDLLKDMLKRESTDRDDTFETLYSDIHLEDRERVVSARNEMIEQNSKEPLSQVYRVRRGDGAQIWVHSSSRLTFDVEGNAIRVTGTLRDITSEREVLASVKQRNRQLELAAELSGVGHWRVDLENDTVFWSDQVHKIHGTDPETYVPELKAGIEFYHPDDVAMVEAAVGEAIEQGKGFDFVARIKRLDGEVRDVHSIGTTQRGDRDQVVAIFGVFQDITDANQKQQDLQQTLKELARSNEELNRFSYVCSHDMKEPVRMIEAMSNLLIDPKFSADDEKRRGLLERIGTNTSRLRGIIDSLLAYSRIDAKVDVETVDLNKIISDIIESLSLVIAESNAKVDLQEMPTVNGAPVHFTQLFQNLIGNALKFSDNKRPLVRISSEKKKDGRILLVEDNGPGIPKKARSEVFNLFSRLQRRDEVDGTGLGLSIVQRIVHQYDGTIECVDTELGGAAFKIWLPLEEEADA